MGLAAERLPSQAFRVGAWSGENRIAPGAAIDGGKLPSSDLLQRPVRLVLAFVGRELARIADHVVRQGDRQRRPVFIHRSQPQRGDTNSIERARARNNSLRAKADMNSAGSCSASAVIDTSTAKATHHGAATERAHPIRE